MIRSSISGALCVSLAFTVSVSFTSVEKAYAQSDDLEEVVVTARKREERLQDIPLSISAFTADDIRKAGVVDLGDIALQTAGINFDPRSSASINGRINNVIRIRGAQVGSSLPHLQPTALFIDGIYSLGGAGSMPLSDLERVEVIKGPQSAFFGRNTFAGAVNYITRNPSLDEFETTLDVSAGQYQQNELSLLTSGPIIEGKLGYQINARLYNRGRLFTTSDGGALGEETTDSVSATLYAEPTDNLSIKLRYIYLKDEDGAAAEIFLRGSDFDTCTGRTYPGRFATDGTPITLDLSGRPAGFGSPADDGGPIDYVCGEPPGFDSSLTRFTTETNTRPAIFSQTPQIVDIGFNSFPADPDALENQLLNQTYLPGVPYLDSFGLERFNRRTALNVDYTFKNDSSLTFLAGLNEQGLNFLRDFDHTDSPAWYSVDPQTFEDTTFEIRYNSPQDQRLRWLAGATYYEQEFITSGGGGLLVAGCVVSCGFASGAFNLPTASGDEAEVSGIFGSVSYDITDKLTIDAELRIMEDERTVTSGGLLLSEAYESEVPRVILSYRFNEDRMLYGQFSQGSLPGRINGVVTICSPDEFTTPWFNPTTGATGTASECAQLAAQGAVPSTPVQELNAFEVGLKQTLLDGRLSLNLVGYVWEWKNKPANVSVQYFRDSPTGNVDDRDGIPNALPNSLGANISGSSDMYGVELESVYRINDNWDVSFNASWSETEFTEFFIGSLEQVIGTTNVKGNEEPRYPNWMANFSASYRDQLNGEWDWFGRADVSYQGDYYGDYFNLLEGPSFVMTNLRAGLEKDDLRVEIFLRNALDEDTWRNVSRGVDFTPNPVNFAFLQFQGVSLAPQTPRTLGVRATISF